MDIANFNMSMVDDETINKTIKQILINNPICYGLNICLIEKYGYKFRSTLTTTPTFDRTGDRIGLVSFILTLKEENPLYDFGNRKFLRNDFVRHANDSVIWAVRLNEIKDLKIKDLLIMMDNFINEIYIEELEHRIEKDNVIIAHETDKENDSMDEWEILKNLYEMFDAPTETNNKSDINKLKTSLPEKDKIDPIDNFLDFLLISIIRGDI